MKRIYLDYAASAPLLPKVKEILEAYGANPLSGNPSSLHQEGRVVRAELDRAHTAIASVFGVHPTEVVLTSGATESNTLIIRGVIAAWRDEHPDETPHVIMSAIEHPSWYNTARDVGADVTVIPVSKEGVVKVTDFVSAVTESTALVGCMYVSNEIGTIQPIAEIGKGIEAWRSEHKTSWPVFHTDAVQAFPWCNTHFGHLHVDALTLSGHKLGALPGIGALIIKRHTPYKSILRGGGQEWGFRAGTENVLGALTLATAVQSLDHRRETVVAQVELLQKALESRLAADLIDVRIIGHSASRAPHIVYIWLPNVVDESFVHKLDLAGFAVSSGSACSSGAMLPSHTLLALGYSDAEAFGGVRISVGHNTTEDDVNAFVDALKAAIG